jgi:hypothetical protein
MKTNLFVIAQCQKVSKIAFAVLTFSVLFTFVPNANASDGISPARLEENEPKSNVTEQIRQFIQMENIDVANLKKGVIVVSFFINESNQISEVVSHSQIPSLDRQLKSSLEGKVVRVGKRDMCNRSEQFVKIRFSVD